MIVCPICVHNSLLVEQQSYTRSYNKNCGNVVVHLWKEFFSASEYVMVLVYSRGMPLKEKPLRLVLNFSGLPWMETVLMVIVLLFVTSFVLCV